MGGAYLPGYEPDMARMLAARTAVQRAGLLLPRLTAGMRLLDLGCGPGTITAGLADAVAPGPVLGVDVAVAQLRLVRAGIGRAAGRADALPVRDGAIDVVYAHAVFEHLTEPMAVLAEIGRVLRPGGLLALSSSDWSAAVIEPRTPDVDAALRAYWAQRRRTGTDPEAGRALAGQVRAAGFAVSAEQTAGRVDMTYTGLARYLADRLTGADAQAATRWAAAGPGRFVQCWVDVLATRR